MRIVREGLDALTLKQKTQEQDEFLRWLAPNTFSEQQALYLKQRHQRSGEWLLDSEKFLQWSRNPGETLLCPGIPGSGKSVLSATIIDHLVPRFARGGEIAVICFYFSFNRQDQQNLEDVLASMVRQLLQEQLTMPTYAKELLQTYQKRDTRPSIDQLRSLVQTLVHSHNRVFVVLDALDECSNANKKQQKIINEVLAIQRESRGKLSLLATTRIIPEILYQFPQSRQIEIRARPEDVEQYIEDRMSELTNTIQSKQQLRQDIKAQIVRLTDGMFLLARLHFESLYDKTTPKAIRKALGDLPKGQQGLSKAYDDALSRIDNQPEGYRQLGRSVITWITYAKRELTIEELQEALAIEPEMECLDAEEDFSDQQEMIGACAGLVVLDPKTGFVRLVHYTTQEYLLQVRQRWIPEAPMIIAQNCMAYLSMSKFKSGWRTDEYEFRQQMKDYKLLQYIGRNWGYHVREVDNCESIQTTCLQILGDEKHLQFVNQVTQTQPWLTRWLGPDAVSWFYGPMNVSPLHLTARFHLRQMTHKLLQEGADINALDSAGRTPLLYAVIEPDLDFLTLLLDQHGISVEVVEEDGYTALLAAAELGDTEAVIALLARDENGLVAKTKRGFNIVSCAARNGHLETVKFLLTKTKAGADTRDEDGRTPLSEVSERGDVEMVKLLLGCNAVDVFTKDNAGLTPLDYARKKSRLEVAAMLQALMK